MCIGRLGWSSFLRKQESRNPFLMLDSSFRWNDDMYDSVAFQYIYGI